MPITVSPLTAGASTNASTAHVTASYTPSANRLILFAVSQRAVLSSNIVLEGNGATWVRTTFVETGPNAEITVFRAMSTAALVAGATTIRFNVVALGQAPVAWSVVEFGGVSTASTDGIDAIVQSVISSASTASSTVLVSMAPFAASGNVSYGAVCQSTDVAMTTGGGFDLLHSQVALTGMAVSSGLGLLTEWKTNDTAIRAVGVSTANKAGIGIEIKESTVSEQRFRRLMVNVGR